MEEGNQKKRNQRPVEKSKLPMVTLLILTGLVIALLYVGYEYLTDDSGKTRELTDVTPDTTQEVVSLDVYAEPSQAEPDKTSETPKTPTTRTEKPSNTPAAVPGGQSYTHTVGKGDTYSGVAGRYNLTVESLKALNPSAGPVLQQGQKLEVKIQTIHTVGPGDILRVVANKYGITVDQLMKANNKTKNNSQRGEKLVIPLAKKQ